jgi:hypothetical protein
MFNPFFCQPLSTFAKPCLGFFFGGRFTKENSGEGGEISHKTLKKRIQNLFISIFDIFLRVRQNISGGAQTPLTLPLGMALCFCALKIARRRKICQ